MATAVSSSPPMRHGDNSREPSSGCVSEKVYVAVEREVAESKATLLWALHKFNQDAAFVLVHVYSQSHPNDLPILGARIIASQVEEQELIAHKEMELPRIGDSLDQYLLLCAQEKVQAEKLVVESDDVAEGLVQLISEHHVAVLVMGAAADKYSYYTKKMKILKSKKARLVEQHADPSIKIWFICKGTLVYHSTRKAVPPSQEAMQEGMQMSSASRSAVERSTSFSEMWCVSNTWIHRPNLRQQIEGTRPYDNEKDDAREFDESDNNLGNILTILV